MNKENINWIFNLRIIASFAVIVLHVSSPIVVNYSSIGLSSWFASNFFDSISRFCVPVFVMISGALLLGKSEDINVFLQKRVKRILFPFLFWTLVYLFFNVFIFNTVEVHSFVEFLMKFFRSVWFGSAFHFWYIYMIIGIYLMIPIINPWVCTTNNKGFLYFFSIWGVSVFFLQYKFEGYKPNFDLIYFSKYLGYFVLGYFLGKNDFSKFKKIILFVYCLSLLAIVAGTYYFSDKANEFFGYFYDYFNFFVICNSISCFLIIKHFYNFELVKNSFFISLNENSYGIYLVHILVLLVFKEIGISGNFIHPILGIPFVAFLCLIVSDLIIKYLKKISLIKQIIG